MGERIDRATLDSRDAKRKAVSTLYVRAISLVSLVICAGIVLLIATILVRGLPAINWEFLSKPPVEGMSAGGIWPMIRGTLLLLFGTLIFSLPLGILAGICLAEYAGQNRFTRLMRASVTSLAGTPSIVYGLFGLAIFVLMFKLGMSLLAGWLTLTVFALPVIVLATENAIRQVPDSLVDGGIALGLSKWQTIRQIVLPHALPGILTGIVLSVGRAAGEAPPILLTAGIYFASEAAEESKKSLLQEVTDTIKEPVANLPYHLAEGYRQGGTIPERIIWGTCLVLCALILMINLVAIIVRARQRRKLEA